MQSDWLSYFYTISHLSAVAVGVLRKNGFSSFTKMFGGTFTWKWIINFLRKLKEVINSTLTVKS